MRVLCAAVILLGMVRPSRPQELQPAATDVSAFDRAEPSCCAESAGSGEAGIIRDADGSSGSRFYISGIIGGSFATLTNPELPDPNSIVNQSLFTGGAALGRAFDRDYGEWRAEFEARSRERMQFVDSDPVAGSVTLRADDGWSTMANVWREYQPTKRIGAYVGGGIGAGGYRCVFGGDVLGSAISGSTSISSFAWQAGGGGTYALSDRITLDVGYRFFSLDAGSANILAASASGTVADSLPTQFSAGELLLSVRVYEPFRRWR